MPGAASPELIELVTCVLSSAPSAATPAAPPSERENATVELAAPLSLAATWFWTARTRVLRVVPTPRPTIAGNTASRPSPSSPTVSSTPPPTR